MKTKFVYLSRFGATLLIATAALFATFYSNTSNVSAAPLQTTCPTNPSVPNDDIDCATAITLSSPYSDSSITDVTQATPVQSSDPTDDPQITECNSTSGLYTVWYSYTAVSDGEVHLDTSGSGYDTVLAVWTGTPHSVLDLVACNDNYSGTPQSDVRFPVVSGTTYYFEVAQFSQLLISSLSAQSEVTQSSSTSLVFNASFRSTPASNLPPSIPSLSAPGNGAIVTTYTPTLDWSNSKLQSNTFFYKYELQVSTASNFSALVQLLAPDSTATTARIFDVNHSYFAPFSNLNSNTVYYWHVRACNASGTGGPDGQCSGWSATRYFRTAILPPVLNVPANGPVPSLRPDFDWQDVTGAKSYNIQISKYSTFSPLVTNATVVPSAYTPTVDLPAGFTLYWRVRAIASTGNFGPSGWSEVRNFNTPKPPSIPVLALPANNALVTNRQPTLDWKDSTMPSGVLTLFDHYEIQIADNSSFTGFNVIIDNITGGITASNYTPASPLNANTKYYWKVRSWDDGGNFSSWSAVWTFREIVDPPALSAPPNTNSPSVYSRRPTFTWSQADTTSVTGYNIQVSKASTFSTLVLNVTVSGAVNQTYTPALDLPATSTLYWRVRTNGSNGPSLWAYPSPWSFTTPNPPSVPALVSPASNALLTNRQPPFDWKDATVPLGTTFDHYQIQVDDNSDFSSTVIDADTTPGDITASNYSPSSPLSANTKYYWRVRSWDNTNPPSGNYSGWSTVWYFREAIDPPTLVAPADTSHQTTLRPTFDWSDVAGASGYNIQVSKVNTFSTVILNANLSGGSNSTYTPSANLPGGSQLYWRVRTTGANGPSDWSSVWSLSTPNGPPLLSAPMNTSVVTSTTPALSWVVPGLAPGTTFDHYEIQVATDSAFTSLAMDDMSITDINTNQIVVSPALSPDSLYYWRVSFFYTANSTTYQTAWSSTWSFKVPIPAPALISPADGTALDGFTTAFSWNSVTGAASYTFQISKVPNFSSTVVNTSRSGVGPTITFTPSNLPGGTVYYWRVRANAASGHYGPSGWSYSPAWSFSTLNLPPTPKTPANGSITANPPTLTWTVPTLTAGSTLTYFDVQIATDSVFTNIVDSTTGSLTTTDYTPSAPLADSTVFYWHVRYVYGNGGPHTTAWSITRSFKTPIATPVLLAPANDPTQASPIADLTPSFDWDNGSGGDITGAASYTIQVSTNSSFTTAVINVTVSGNTNSSYTPTTNLTAGTQYYWRVRANAMSGYFGPSAWSTVWTFTTAP